MVCPYFVAKGSQCIHACMKMHLRPVRTPNIYVRCLIALMSRREFPTTQLSIGGEELPGNYELLHRQCLHFIERAERKEK